MKKLSKLNQGGFIIPLLLSIIAVLVIGGGVYAYHEMKMQQATTASTTAEMNVDETASTSGDVSSNSLSNNSTQATTNTPVTSQSNISSSSQKICSYQSNLDPFEAQAGVLFQALGTNCAVIQKQANGYQVVFNGISSSVYPQIFLSEDPLNFSPDGKHFAFVASNIGKGTLQNGTFLEGQRFAVVDNVAGKVYDNVDSPEYSSDGQHFGYCAQSGGYFTNQAAAQYYKVVDGVETEITQPETTNDCFPLFPLASKYKTNNNASVSLPGSKYSLSTDFSTACTNMMGECSIHLFVKNNVSGTTQTFGPYGEIDDEVLSPDENNFAFVVPDNTMNKPGELAVNVYLNGKVVGSYNEVENVIFSDDSHSLTYNARIGTDVYYVTQSF
jgi:hypothetical protein